MVAERAEGSICCEGCAAQQCTGRDLCSICRGGGGRGGGGGGGPVGGAGGPGGAGSGGGDDRVNYVGWTVSKVFPGHGTFKGVVVSRVARGGTSNRRTYWHVRYADGDEEDLSSRELQPLLVPPALGS